jgi:hypothetical protein
VTEKNEVCACGHEAWWHWGNAGPCHNSPCDCGVFTNPPAVTTHELEEDFSAQLSRGDSRWWCTCGKWSTPIWHTPHAVREHAGHVREVEGAAT